MQTPFLETAQNMLLMHNMRPSPIDMNNKRGLMVSEIMLFLEFKLLRMILGISPRVRLYAALCNFRRLSGTAAGMVAIFILLNSIIELLFHHQ